MHRYFVSVSDFSSFPGRNGKHIPESSNVKETSNNYRVHSSQSYHIMFVICYAFSHSGIHRLYRLGYRGFQEFVLWQGQLGEHVQQNQHPNTRGEPLRNGHDRSDVSIVCFWNSFYIDIHIDTQLV